MSTPKENADYIFELLNPVFESLLKKFPNIDATIHIGGYVTQGMDKPFLITIDLDSIKSDKI